jgi:hypothetical protein
VPRSIEQRLETKEKQRLALKLRTQGGTFQDIARQVGYSNGGAAYKAVNRALDQVDYEAAVELRQVQLLRLKELLECAWRAATDDAHVHQVRAVGQVLDIIDRMNALAGIGRRWSSSAMPWLRRCGIGLTSGKRINVEEFKVTP